MSIGSGEIGNPARARIACAFKVILDRPINLALGGDIDRTFEFDLDEFVKVKERVIVSFMLLRAESLRLELTLNRETDDIRAYGPGPERTVHETFGGVAQRRDNELTLRVIQGSCSISDLVVWYQIQA